MIVNQSCFRADITSGLDSRGVPYYLVVVTAAFQSSVDGYIEPSSLPCLFHTADVYYGDPTLSSVKYEADTAPEKSKVDIIVNGAALARPGSTVDRIKVSLRVADIHKELIVIGDRPRLGVFGTVSNPQPFSSMPIVYERAFGGTLNERGKFEMEPRNPVGVGHKGANAVDHSVKTSMPNVSYLDGRNAIAGFGFISRQWQPRLPLAGTYDATWQTKRWPLLPDDFNSSYFQAAPLDQQSDKIRGGDIVEVENMTLTGKWRFRLPTLSVPIFCIYSDRIDRIKLRTDTIILEPNTYGITLKARAKIVVSRKHVPLRQVIVGHVSPAWLRALASGKRYWDQGGSEGRIQGAKDYEL